ncbi:hypothetical protein C8Q72DRAFT_885922 [Fomitopsis betulina]|nr:hypothetical protein C8Q72DRAFT_885922 [Fomitopsis betulina]
MGLFDLFGHDDSRQHNEQIYNTQYVPEQHQSSWTHEAIAAAAGFEAMKSYENHLRQTGQQPNHAVMKELLAGFAAAEIDKLAETKGLDYIDREKAKRQAVEQAHHIASERYGHGQTGVEYLRQNGGYGADYNPGYGGGYNRPPAGPPRGEYGGGYGGPPGGGYGGPPGGGYGGPPGGGYGGPPGGGYGGQQGGYGGGYEGGYPQAPQGGYGGQQGYGGGYGGQSGGYRDDNY